MKKTVRKLAVLSGLALTIASLSLAPSAVAHPAGGSGKPAKPRTVYVHGEQFPAAVPDYTMTGSLVGFWEYNAQSAPLFTNEAGTLYSEAGTERFTGCLDRRRDGSCDGDPKGEFITTFLYWASFDADGGLIRGDCVHPITGGNGVFTGARGRIDMVDRPLPDRVKTTYRGQIVLNAVAEDPIPALTQNLRTPNLQTQDSAASGPRKGC